MPSYIYVASDGTTSKIGITAWPASRISGIRRLTSCDYTICQLWKTDADTAIEIEELVIGKMAERCIQGREWFNATSYELIAAVDEIARSNGHEIEQSAMPKQEKGHLYSFEFPQIYRDMADDIADMRNKAESWRGRKAGKAEAIRYAIAFTHKQLTEVLNPEDLRDD